MELGKARHELELQETTLKREREMLKHQLTEVEQECQLAIKNQKLTFEKELGCLRKEKVRAAGLQPYGSNNARTVHSGSLPRSHSRYKMHRHCFSYKDHLFVYTIDIPLKYTLIWFGYILEYIFKLNFTHPRLYSQPEAPVAAYIKYLKMIVVYWPL